MTTPPPPPPPLPLAPVESRRATLLQVARMLSSATDVEELLYHILEQSRVVMNSEVCSVLLPVNEAGDLRIRSTKEVPGIENLIIPGGKGIAGEVFRSKRPIYMRDARSDPRFYGQAAARSGIDVRAMLTIPLLDGERCLGVLQVINPADGGLFTAEDEEIFETFGSLCAATLMRLEAHELTVRELQQREQLGLAREIQRSFLPPGASRFGDLELASFYEPASAIGGDFYFWHALDDDHVLFGIGDVTGKGLPAALDMARGSTLIASLAFRALEHPLGEWLSLVNRGLCDVMTAGRFIGVGVMLANRRTRRMQVCVAGLPKPMVRLNGSWREVEAPANPPLGITCSLSYRHTELPLAYGRHWLLFSDGILEQANAEGEFFEDSAFACTLNEAGQLSSAAEVCDRLSENWRHFGGRRPDYRDDATVIVLTDTTERPPTTHQFTCCADTISEGRRFVENWAACAGFDEEDRGKIVMGCDEIMTNLVKHVFKPENGEALGSGPVDCSIDLNERGLVVRIEHQGRGLSDEEFTACLRPPDPMTRVGGLGLFLVQQVFDDIRCFPGNPDQHENAAIELEKHW